MINSEFHGMPIVAWILDDKRHAQLLQNFLDTQNPRVSTVVVSAEGVRHTWYKVLITSDDIEFDVYTQVSRDCDSFQAGYNARVQQEIEEKWDDN
jgi:hypothetical protein